MSACNMNCIVLSVFFHLTFLPPKAKKRIPHFINRTTIKLKENLGESGKVWPAQSIKDLEPLTYSGTVLRHSAQQNMFRSSIRQVNRPWAISGWHWCIGWPHQPVHKNWWIDWTFPNRKDNWKKWNNQTHCNHIYIYTYIQIYIYIYITI